MVLFKNRVQYFYSRSGLRSKALHYVVNHCMANHMEVDPKQEIKVECFALTKVSYGKVYSAQLFIFSHDVLSELHIFSRCYLFLNAFQRTISA